MSNADNTVTGFGTDVLDPQLTQYPVPSEPDFNQMTEQTQPQLQPNNINQNIIEETWEQTQINLCLLVAMLKEKNLENKQIISDIENIPLPERLGKLQCNSYVIAPILNKIKNTMKIINKEMSDEQILDRLLSSNISLIKKYIQLYVNIINNVDKKSVNMDISDEEFKKGVEMFLAIPKKLDELLNNMPSLKTEDNQGLGQGQSIGNAESAELIIGIVSGIFATAQILGGKKGKKNKKSKKNQKSKKNKGRRRSRKMLK